MTHHLWTWYIELIIIGLLLTAPRFCVMVVNHITLMFRVIICFIWWGMSCGTRSYRVVFVNRKGQLRHITIGAWDED